MKNSRAPVLKHSKNSEKKKQLNGKNLLFGYDLKKYADRGGCRATTQKAW